MTSRPGVTLVERVLYELAFRAETDARARAILIRLVNVFFRAVALDRNHGTGRLLGFARTAAVRFGRWRAPVLKRKLDLDGADMSDLGRAQDWEDRVFGVTGHWSERTTTRATKCETACPFADTARAAPELCTDVIHALETATFRELNPTYRLMPLERLLSKGHQECVFRHAIE